MTQAMRGPDKPLIISRWANCVDPMLNDCVLLMSHSYASSSFRCRLYNMASTLVAAAQTVQQMGLA